MGRRQPQRRIEPAAAGSRKRGRRPGATAPTDEAPPPKQKRRATWPYGLVMLLAWGLIFGGVFFSHFLSNLPGVHNLMVAGPPQDITILDARGRLRARRGLTHGASGRADDMPA